MDNPIAEAYIKMLQERNKKEDKLDPVGQGDADIDNDGDVDSSDEYLHKRRKAIKKSMKKEEFTEEEQALIDEAKKRGLTPDQVRKALAADKAKAKGKSKVSLRKTPWDKFKEAVEIETDDDKTDVEDPKAAKAKKKAPEKNNQDPAAKNAPSQDDRADTADKPDPTPVPEKEPAPEKDEPAPEKKKEKIVVKNKKDDDKEEIEEISVAMQKRYMSKAKSQYKSSAKKKSVGGDFGGSKTQAAADRHKKTYDKRHKGIGSVIKRASDHDQKRKGGAFVSQNPSKNSMTGKKAPYRNRTESFDWDEIAEMNNDQIDAFIDTLNESQLDAFEAEMNSLAEAANPEGDATQQDKEQGEFIAKHKKEVIDRPDADKPKAADATKPAPKRPGDKTDGDKSPVKRMKDIRK